MGGKLTLLGYAGVLPNVALYVPDITKPIQFTFVLATGPGSGTFNMAFEIEKIGAPASLVIRQVMEVAVINPAASAVNFGTGLVGVFPGTGQYELRVFADKTMVYSGRFALEQGPAPVITPQR